MQTPNTLIDCGLCGFKQTKGNQKWIYQFQVFVVVLNQWWHRRLLLKHSSYRSLFFWILWNSFLSHIILIRKISLLHILWVLSRAIHFTGYIGKWKKYAGNFVPKIQFFIVNSSKWNIFDIQMGQYNRINFDSLATHQIFHCNARYLSFFSLEEFWFYLFRSMNERTVRLLLLILFKSYENFDFVLIHFFQPRQADDSFSIKILTVRMNGK